MRFNGISDFVLASWRATEVATAIVLLGPPGTGKSALSVAIAARMTEYVQSKSPGAAPAIVEIVDLSSRLPEDISGLPYRALVDGRETTLYAPQSWLSRMCKKGAYGILLLDDLPAAAPAVQVAVRQLVLDRRVGEDKLAPMVQIIVTGNRREDKSAATTLPAHFRNSVCLLDVETNIEEWCDWYGQQQGHAPVIASFLRYRPVLHSTLPKDADKRGAFATPRCFDPETEVLTRRGFVKWPEVNPETDEFAQMDMNGVATWAKPEQFFKVRHAGQMVKFSGQHLDMLVTPNHNMLVSRGYASGVADYNSFDREDGFEAESEEMVNRFNSDEFILLPAENIMREVNTKPSYAFHMRADAKWEGDDSGFKQIGDKQVPWPIWAEFLGWYLTDGCVTRHTNNPNTKLVQITQVEDEYRNRVAWLCSQVCSRDNVPNPEGKDRVRFTDPVLYDELKQYGSKHKGERFVPREILDRGIETNTAFVRGAWGGDGWSCKGGTYIAIGPNPKLADGLQEACLKMGQTARVKTRLSSTGRLLWEVTVMGKKYARPVVSHKNVSVVDYDGDVYCVKVPNSILCVRRNGHVIWAGNSWSKLGRLYDIAHNLGFLLDVAAGLVGEGPATEFMAFVNVKAQLVDPASVLLDPKGQIPNPKDALSSPDRAYAMTTGLGEIAAAWRNGPDAKKKAAAPLCLMRALGHCTTGNREFISTGVATYTSNGGQINDLILASRSAMNDPLVKAVIDFLHTTFNK